jgi:hypothetical protein
MIIFTGVYCAKLMKQWANFDKAKVIFNESHWSGEVLQFIDKCNNQETTTTKIIAETVDEGLTPIIQVLDVAVNKVFKDGVKKLYHELCSSLPVTVGKKLPSQENS